MATWTLQDKIVSSANDRTGTYGDVAPVDSVAGDTLVCGNDRISGSGYLAGDVGQGNLKPGLYVIGGNDTITGSDKTDIINGGGGNDSIDGRGGVDYVEYAEPHNVVPADAHVVVDLAAGQSWSSYYGNDTLIGIEGVIGSFGGDWIAGSAVANELLGGFGNDVMYGRGGNDTLSGDAGNDALYGEGDDDTLIDRGGQNWLSGGDGRDTLTVSGGKAGEWSAVHGDAGNDTIEGSSQGSSVGLCGDAGDDLIRFGSGVCYIQGGSGADRFGPAASAWSDPASFAQVFDFEKGIDKVTVAGIAGVHVDVLDWGANTGLVMTDAAGHKTTLMLMAITKAQFDPAVDLLTV